VRRVCDAFPGRVQVHLDLAGGVAKVIDKWPMFAADDRLRPDSEYPVAVDLDCEQAADTGLAADAGVADITLLHGVGDPADNDTSRMRRDDLIVVTDPPPAGPEGDPASR
jgi:hypothetical protein